MMQDNHYNSVEATTNLQVIQPAKVELKGPSQIQVGVTNYFMRVNVYENNITFFEIKNVKLQCECSNVHLNSFLMQFATM